MIVVAAMLKAQEGKEKEMEDALTAYMPQVQAEEGTLLYVVHRARKDPVKFFIYEQYRDRDALIHHGSTDAFKELFNNLAPLLAGDPSIDTYEVVVAKQ